MNAFILVGATGSGKTSITRHILLKNVHPRSTIIYDTNKEWQDFYPEPFNPDMDKFLEKCSKVHNAVILIEDATSFFAVQGRSEDLIKILIAKRHTNNTIILLFHSWGDVPRYLYRKCTHAVIFKTHDSEKDVMKVGNIQLLNVWKEVQEESKTHKFFSSMPPPKGTWPPPYRILNL